MAYTATQLKQKYDEVLAYLIILLKARGCWTQDHPEIPEEISAQFDLPLDTAQNLVDFFQQKV